MELTHEQKEVLEEVVEYIRDMGKYLPPTVFANSLNFFTPVTYVSHSSNLPPHHVVVLPGDKSYAWESRAIMRISYLLKRGKL